MSVEMLTFTSGVVFWEQYTFSHASSQTCSRKRKTVFFLAPLYTYAFLQKERIIRGTALVERRHRPDHNPFAREDLVAEAYQLSHDQLLQLTYQRLIGNANNTF